MVSRCQPIVTGSLYPETISYALIAHAQILHLARRIPTLVLELTTESVGVFHGGRSVALLTGRDAAAAFRVCARVGIIYMGACGNLFSWQ